jgi:hypothetical protein
MNKAKLINSQLIYAESYMNGISNPTDEMLAEWGYKEVIFHEGNNDTYEDGDFIIVETPAPAPAPLTPAKQREQAYATEAVIKWNGEMLTCDNARLNRMSAYFYSGQTDKYEALKALWLQAREEIQMKYPD